MGGRNILIALKTLFRTHPSPGYAVYEQVCADATVRHSQRGEANSQGFVEIPANLQDSSEQLATLRESDPLGGLTRNRVHHDRASSF